MEGTCLCGAVTVKVFDDELFTRPRGHFCHCDNCRKTSAGLYGSNLLIETEKVQITGEENLTRYEDPDSMSGKPVGRYFCKTCGSPIKTMADVYVGKTVLKMGIYRKVPTPEWESFAVRRQAFERPIEGAIQYKIASGGEKLE